MRIISTKFSNFIAINSVTNNNRNNVETIKHIPVLAQEITKILSPKDGQCFLDLTFGGGGHTKHLLSTNKKITIFTLDRDPYAFEKAEILAKTIEQNNHFGQKIIPMLGRFSEIDDLLKKIQIPYHSFDGAIMDLGASSFQYDNPQRGFSFRNDGPLDMRMDGERNQRLPSAADIINTLNADELAKIFKVYGEERHAKKIAQTIVDSRFLMKRLNTTRELAELVQSVLSRSNDISATRDKIGRPIHPATKIFQALRIFVNNELNELNSVIPVLSKYLKISEESDDKDDDNEFIAQKRSNGGLLAIISFHSLEDRIVKSHFVNQSDNNLILPPKSNDYIIHPTINDIYQTPKSLKIWKFYQKKFQLPTETEILLNPRARSAKLRVGLRING